MKKVYQLWGLTPPDEKSKAALIDTVKRLTPFGAQALILGQSDDAAFQRVLCERAHKAGIRAYLWAPLLSEYDGFAAFDPHIGADGLPLPRAFGDAFNFRCPASKKNLDAFFAMQDARLLSAPFDGVFLDRVRYPSFAHGALSALGCFCPDCVRRYERAGIDVPALRRALRYGENPLAITGFDGSGYTFSDPDMARFFEVRAGVVTEAVRYVAAHYARQSLGVALDLFPPQFAYLCGQSLRALLPMSDFVKPMLYRVTDAPAGLPFERAAYARAAGPLSVPDACFAPFGPDIESAQVAAYERVGRAFPEGKIAWGVEVCRVNGVADATRESVLTALSAIQKGGGRAACASWSLISADSEALDAFILA